MMGLRLLDRGVSGERFYTRFKQKMEVVFEKEIEELIDQELLAWNGQKSSDLHLTKRGTMLGNQVFMKFV